MSTSTSLKAKTNWMLVLWPTLFLWSVSAVYVFNSDLRSQADEFLPILMVVSVFLVLIANGIAGSVAQARIDQKVAFGDVKACSVCGRSECHLEILSYEYMLLLGIVAIQKKLTGVFCEFCARRAINKAFLASMFGCILFPPLILFAFLKRNAILGKYRQDRKQRRGEGDSSRLP